MRVVPSRAALRRTSSGLPEPCAESAEPSTCGESRSPTSSAARGDERPDRPPRARRRRDWDPRARPRRLRPPPPRASSTPRPPATSRCATSAGRWITYNGEVYNYPELRAELGGSLRTGTRHRGRAARARPLGRRLRSTACAGCSPTRSGTRPSDELLCARDRFGIKPFYYAQVGDVLYFASEARRCCRSCPRSRPTSRGSRTTWPSSSASPARRSSRACASCCPATSCACATASVAGRRATGRSTTTSTWTTRRSTSRSGSRALLEESVELHLRSDVPVSAYLSGGLDSSTVASLASRSSSERMKAFTGRFPEDARYDESRYARALADERGLDLRDRRHRRRRLPRARSRTSSTTSTTRPPARARSRSTWSPRRPRREAKVILGGQGGDEIFGGYTRYLIAYFEQCIKAAIDGTMHSGNFVVTYESIIPNLVALQNYKPLLKEFWREGLFEDLDARYFRLINRAPHLGGEVDFDALGDYSPFETFQEHLQRRQRRPRVVLRQDDPLRLQDAAAGAAAGRGPGEHGPRPRVAGAAARPRARRARGDDPGGREVQGRHDEARLQAAPRARSCRTRSPSARTRWASRCRCTSGCAARRASSSTDVFVAAQARGRELFDNRKVLAGLERENRFGRQTWGLLCLELWQRPFHDREHEFKRLLTDERNGE